MGDSLWTQLYPIQHYKRAYSGSSYSEIPLSEMISRHVVNECRSDDWNFMIVHDNELDHGVHMFGWPHPRVIASIKESDNEIDTAVKAIQADSLVLAFGDHGSTREGHHGGGTKEERESAMFAYTRKGFTFRALKYYEELSPKVQELIKLAGDKINNTFTNRDSFSQIDAVAAMASIYNIPIPYSNIGVIPPEIMHYDNCTVVDCLYELFMDHILNFAQVLNYVSDFARKNSEIIDQKAALEWAMMDIKPKTISIVQRFTNAIRAERQFLNGTAMSEEIKGEYRKIIGDMFEVMVRIRMELEQNSLVLKSQWTAMNFILLYTNLIIRVVVTAMILATILLLYLRVKKDATDFFESSITSGFVPLGLVVTLFALLKYSTIMYTELAGVYCLLSVGLLLLYRIIKRHKSDILGLMRSETDYMPTVLAFVLMFCLVYCYATSAMGQRNILL